jgi:deoxyadenosine/deoxycytidine kinase
MCTSDKNSFASQGQPLELSVVKQIECYLQAMGDHYNTWIQEQDILEDIPILYIVLGLG